MDRLYASISENIGDIDEHNFVELEDKFILKTLSDQNKKRWLNGFVRTSNTKSALRLFLFAVQNSNAEWGLNGYQENGRTSFRLRTSYDSGKINHIYDKKELNMTFAMHSHAGE